MNPSPLTTVFLHGFLGQPSDWAPVQAALGPALRVRIPLLPGHGVAAEPDEDAFISAQAALGPCRLVGYSLGGRIALRWALAHPAAVQSLVLVSASPGLEREADRVDRRERDAAWAAQLRAGDRAAFLEAWYDQPVFSALRAKKFLLADVVKRRALGSLDDLAAAVERMSPGRIPSLWDRLGELSMPVLHVAGEGDPAYRAMSRRAAGLSPRGTARSIPDSGHAVPEEQPATLAASLQAWWSEIAREMETSA